MRTNDYRPGRRSGKRGSGPRRRSRSGGNAPTVATKAPQKKQSLIERIIAFFTGGKKATPAKRSSAPAAAPRSTEPSRPSRKPEAVEVTSPKLYVGNLSYDASESDLFELFRGAGIVQNAEVVSHKGSMKSKGFGFVTMASIDDAKRAVEVLHDKDFMGRKLVVSGAKTNDVRFSSASSSESSEARTQEEAA